DLDDIQAAEQRRETTEAIVPRVEVRLFLNEQVTYVAQKSPSRLVCDVGNRGSDKLDRSLCYFLQGAIGLCFLSALPFAGRLFVFTQDFDVNEFIAGGNERIRCFL